MARLVDSLLRGRAQPSARNEAAAAVSDVRAFVRAWRPTPSSGTSEAAAGTSRVLDAHQGGVANSSNAGGHNQGEDRSSGSSGSSGPPVPNKPSADVLLKLAQVCAPDDGTTIPSKLSKRWGVFAPRSRIIS